MTIKFIEIDEKICILPFSFIITGRNDVDKVAKPIMWSNYLHIRTEIETWLNAEIHEFNWKFIDNGLFNGIDLMFKHKEDALKFKMTWL